MTFSCSAAPRRYDSIRFDTIRYDTTVAVYFLACKCWWFSYLLHTSSFVSLSPLGAAVRGDKTSRERQRDYGRRCSRTRQTTTHQDRHCHCHFHDIDLLVIEAAFSLTATEHWKLVCCDRQPKTIQDKTEHSTHVVLKSSSPLPIKTRTTSRGDVDVPRPPGTTQYQYDNTIRPGIQFYFPTADNLDRLMLSPLVPPLPRRVASSRSA